MTVKYSGPVDLVWGYGSRAGEWEFTLHEPFWVRWERRDRAGASLEIWEFEVKAGFTTDLASVPRIFRSLIPQVGRHLQAAIVHDWCYENIVEGLADGDRAIMTRKEADLLFLEGMKEAGVSWLKRKLMYWAVRVAGASWWG